jgi:hypothetical protein
VSALRGFSPVEGRISESVHKKTKEGLAALSLMKQDSTDVKLMMPVDIEEDQDQFFMPDEAKRSSVVA